MRNIEIMAHLTPKYKVQNKDISRNLTSSLSSLDSILLSNADLLSGPSAVPTQNFRSRLLLTLVGFPPTIIQVFPSFPIHLGLNMMYGGERGIDLIRFYTESD